MKRMLVVFLTVAIFGLLARTTLAQGPTGKNGPEFVPGELLVKFRAQTGAAARQTALRSVDAQTLSVSPYSGVQRVRVQAGRELAAIATLAARPEVEFADPNYILTAQQTPNDPSFGLLWGLNNTGQAGGSADADIDAPEAWDIHTGSSSVIIAMVDTGIDLDHEDLAARIWTNLAEIPGNGIDDDNNGYIDDVNGWDFCTSPYNSITARCTSPPDNNPNDDFGHGSHVAGIAAATGNNGIGVTGVSWRATLMAVKVLDQFGVGTVSSVANGVDYAVANGANIINLSLSASGTQYPCNSFSTLNQALQRAAAGGVMITGASGNYGTSTVSCPAARHEVMAVGATDPADERRVSSDYGPRLEVVAPGENIYSTTYFNGYTTKDGTSMAAAYTTGLAALLWSYSPALKHDDVRRIIRDTADDVGAPGIDLETGHGRINAWRGLEALQKLRTERGSVSFLIADNSPSPPPISTTVNLLSNSPGTISYTTAISPAVSWLGLNGGVPLAVTLVATLPTPVVYGRYTTSLVINVETTAGQPLGTRTVDVYLHYIAHAELRYFPLILKNYTPRPDLRVENLLASSNGVTVTVKNRGDAPVTDAFWVDVYFDPTQTPALNKPWNQIAGHGVVWGVTKTLPPGASLTLTTNGPYYLSQYSSPLPLPVGANVYAFVDSINYSTNYGNVKEHDEGNNLSAKIVSTAGTGRSGGVSPAGNSRGLPAR